MYHFFTVTDNLSETSSQSPISPLHLKMNYFNTRNCTEKFTYLDSDFSCLSDAIKEKDATSEMVLTSIKNVCKIELKTHLSIISDELYTIFTLKVQYF